MNSEAKKSMTKKWRWRFLYPLLFWGFAVLMVQLWQRENIRQLDGYIRSLEEKKRNLIRVNKELQIQLAELTSLKRIQRVARERLGMGPPASQPVIIHIPAQEFLLKIPRWEGEGKDVDELLKINPELLIKGVQE